MDLNHCLTPQQVQGLVVHSVNDRDFISLLTKYMQLFSSIYGPNGSSVLYQSQFFRVVDISSSQEILKELQFSHPLLRMINSAIATQNEEFHLYGSYVGILCSSLMLESIKMEDYIPYYIIADLSNFILSEMLNVLRIRYDIISLKFDLQNIAHYICFVKTILNSKHSFHGNEIDIFSTNIVRCVLKSLSVKCDHFGNIYVMNVARHSDIYPQLFDGLLLQISDIQRPVKKNNLNIIIFNISLMLESINKEIYANFFGSIGDRGNYLYSYLVKIIQRNNIHILACQKEINGEIKFFLERAGVLVLERLGTDATVKLSMLSNCHPMNELSEATNLSLGKILHFETVTLGHSTFVLLRNNEPSCITFVIPSYSEVLDDKIKSVVNSAIFGLRKALEDPHFIIGGGKLEKWISSWILENYYMIQDKFNYNPTYTLSVIQSLSGVFLRISSLLEDKADSSSSENLFTKAKVFVKNEVYDLFSAKINAVKIAKELFVNLHKVKYCIYDDNM